VPRSAPRYLIWKHGAWYGHWRWVDPDGTVHWPSPRSPYTDKKRDERRAAVWAGAAREAWIQERRRVQAEQAQAAVAGPTLGDVARAWLADAAARGVNTTSESYRLELMLADLGAERPIRELAPADVLAWRDTLRHRTIRSQRKRPLRKGEKARPPRRLSSRSVNAYLVLLSMVCNFGIRQGVLLTNPARAVGKIQVDAGVPEILTTAQITALLEALDDYEAEQLTTPKAGALYTSAAPMRGIVLAAYYTLARTDNVLSLTWPQVQLAANAVHYPETKNRRPVTAPMRAPLRAYFEARHPGRAARGPVFPNPATGKPYTDVRKQWRRLLALANARLEPADRIRDGFKMYNLRHSGASALARAGVPAKIIADLMGDTSIATVERHYFGFEQEALREELARAADHPTLRAIDAVASAERGRVH
jgi:integrase